MAKLDITNLKASIGDCGGKVEICIPCALKNISLLIQSEGKIIEPVWRS